MKLRNKILIGVAATFAVGFTALALAMSYESPCPPVIALDAATETMRAVTQRCYGPPSVLRMARTAKPKPKAKPAAKKAAPKAQAKPAAKKGGKKRR